VNQKLKERQENLQEEINELEDELKENQNPERMSLIQEMISVSSAWNLLCPCPSTPFDSGSFWSNVPYTRKGHRIGGCSSQHNQRHPGSRPREEELDYKYDGAAPVADVRFVIAFFFLAVHPF